MPRFVRSRLTLASLLLSLIAAAAAGTAPAADRIAVTTQRSASAGALVVVPIEIRADAGAEAIEFVLTYSPRVLTPLGVYRTTATREFELVVDLGTEGRAGVVLDGGHALLGPGPVAWFLFRGHGVAGAETTLAIEDARINGSSEIVVEDGSVRFGAGQVALSFPADVTVAAGAGFTAALSADDAAGILAADLRIEYDPAVVQAVSVMRTPISQSFSLTPNLNNPGVILISLFGTQPMVGSGPILEFDFQVVGSAGQSTPLDLVSAGINEGGIAATLADGLVTVCDGADLDGDGVSLCDGDCDDDDDGRFPGNPEIGCDGIDQDCDELTVDVLDGDADLFLCDVDCNDGNPSINPAAEEVCDGLDNDCDLGVDNVAPPSTVVQVAADGGGGPTLSWPGSPEATGYDVVRGALGVLRSSLGDFGQAVDDCLADDGGDTFVDDPDEPLSSDGFWYLVRPTNCGGNGSYDSGGAGQNGSRGAEIAGSPAACP